LAVIAEGRHLGLRAGLNGTPQGEISKPPAKIMRHRHGADNIYTTSRTLINAAAYGIASKSAIVNLVPPCACMAARVSLISALSRDCISGFLASSNSAQLRVFEVVS
jgi:hypothetical protein